MSQFDNTGSADDAGYFSHHGWLAPGVKLFRRLSFPAKSAWILISVLVPILSLLVLLYGANSELIDSTKLEREGVSYVKAANEFIKDLSDLRHSALTKAPDIKERQNKVGKSFGALQALQKAERVKSLRERMAREVFSMSMMSRNRDDFMIASLANLAVSLR